MKPLSLTALFAALSLCLLSACKESPTPPKDDDPADATTNWITGIARSFDNGVVYDDDTADWQPRTSHTNVLATFMPPFPNPLSTNCVFQVTLAESMSVEAVAVDKARDTVAFPVVRQILPVGSFQFSWNAKDSTGKDLPSGLYRIYFNTETVAGPIKRVSSYGDVEISR